VEVVGHDDSDEIYRTEVAADHKETINSLDPYMGTVRNSKNEVIDEFYDY
jgi:hypothetical protein